MISNREISRMFSLYAELLQLHQQDERLAALLSGAAYRLRNMEELHHLSQEQLSTLFRPQINSLFKELQVSGSIEALDELIQLTPSGLFDMMRIRGLGGKKLSVLWKEAKIDSIDQLLAACKNNELTKLPGFGKKTQQNIIDAIESYRTNQDRFHYASVADLANQLVIALQKMFRTKYVSLCGEIRRQSTTVESIEIVTAINSKTLASAAIRKYLIIQSTSKNETKAHSYEEIPVNIYHTSEKEFYHELFLRTGNKEHVEKVLKRTKAKTDTSEEAVYKKASLPFIPPELRENIAEW